MEQFGVIVFFLIIVGLNQLSLRRITDIVVNNPQEPLNDVLHSMIPEWMVEYQEYTDWFPILVIVIFGICDKLEHSIDFIRLLGILYLLRMISYNMTLIPSPDVNCKKTEPDTFLRGLLYNIWEEGCGDLIFSGHTMCMVLASMFLYNYCFLNNPIIAGLLVMYNILGIFVIVGSRMHYSVDALMATIVTILLGQNYFLSNR